MSSQFFSAVLWPTLIRSHHYSKFSNHTTADRLQLWCTSICPCSVPSTHPATALACGLHASMSVCAVAKPSCGHRDNVNTCSYQGLFPWSMWENYWHLPHYYYTTQREWPLLTMCYRQKTYVCLWKMKSEMKQVFSQNMPKHITNIINMSSIISFTAVVGTVSLLSSYLTFLQLSHDSSWFVHVQWIHNYNISTWASACFIFSLEGSTGPYV